MFGTLSEVDLCQISACRWTHSNRQHRRELPDRLTVTKACWWCGVGRREGEQGWTGLQSFVSHRWRDERGREGGWEGGGKLLMKSYSRDGEMHGVAVEKDANMPYVCVWLSEYVQRRGLCSIPLHPFPLSFPSQTSQTTSATRWRGISVKLVLLSGVFF